MQDLKRHVEEVHGLTNSRGLASSEMKTVEQLHWNDHHPSAWKHSVDDLFVYIDEADKEEV